MSKYKIGKMKLTKDPYRPYLIEPINAYRLKRARDSR